MNKNKRKTTLDIVIISHKQKKKIQLDFDIRLGSITSKSSEHNIFILLSSGVARHCTM